MALINCPECGKEVSDKAKNCPNCGYTISEHKIVEEEIKIPIENFAITLFGQDKGKIMFYNQSGTETLDDYFSQGDRVKLLDADGEVIAFGNLDSYSYPYNMNTKINCHNFGVKDIGKDIASNVKFIVKNMEIKDNDRANILKEINVKCPKCGSTQIQAVPRKWSLMTGILTNKVDRVCLNCKHKF